MTDLNMMMREQARAGLQTQLDAAVTNGDTEAARKIAGDIEKLAVQTAPKAPPYGDVEIKAALAAKAPWFGVDPKKSGTALAFGKDMDPKKFASAEAFAEALVKAVEAEYAPAAAAPAAEDDTDPDADPDDEDDAPPPAKKPRKTDSPGEADAVGARASARRTGPWTKLAEAPADIQKEIRRQADKFVSPKAPKEQRDKFVSAALESHYAAHQRNKGKR